MLDSLGKRLRFLRDGRGLNQKELAKALTDAGVPVKNKHISDIERGQRNPSVEILRGLADVLGTTTDYLLLRSHNSTPSENEPNTIFIEPHADADSVQRMADIFASLSRADQEMIVRLAEGLRATDTPRIIGEESQ